MTLVFAAGGEDGHVHPVGGTVAGPWYDAVDIQREGTIGVYTGAYSYKLGLLAAGGSLSTTYTSAVWWSHTVTFTAFGDGTYRCLFQISSYGEHDRFVGLKKGIIGGNNYAKLGLWSDNVGTALGESGEFIFNAIHLFKYECAEGHWTFWGSLSGGAWAPLFTYDDSGNFELIAGEFTPDPATDEGKGAGYAIPYVDDLHLWDDQGDNWNSRIGANDFPRVSVAHLPNTTDAKTESDAGQAALIDEMPPDQVAKASIDETDYWTDVDNLDETGSATHPDLRDETIQAVIVTHAFEDFDVETELVKFNLYVGSTLYADSEDGLVQRGYCWHPGYEDYATYAGHYAWTKDTPRANWTEELFEFYKYGISLVDGKTDQMTVQVVFFGSSHEWEPEVEAAVRRIFITGY